MPALPPAAAPREPALFSVIVLNFNYARYLPQAIDSALGQTHRAVEVIVVDDASTDDSRRVIAGYGERIVPCLRARNGGMSASANSGFALSRGAHVLFLDADDYLHPDALAAMLAVWRPGVAQVQARLDLVDADGTAHDIFPPPETPLAQGDVRPLLARRGRYSTTVTTGLAFTRAALEAVMPIPEAAFDRSADGYLTAVVPFHGEVVSIDRPLGAYRRHPSNHSGFAANIATRARWRIDHDEQRHAAMRRQAAATGVAMAAAPGLADALHLEERIASLCFDPARHPYPQDRRARLGWLGIQAVLAGRPGLKRAVVHSAIFAVAGLAPRPLARTILAWKMERSTRPQVIDRLSGWLRRRLG